MTQDQIKMVAFGTVLAGWLSAMLYWVFVDHIRPDPAAWAVPVTLYFTLWPRLTGGGGDEPK